jgi:hypothetical protein
VPFVRVPLPAPGGVLAYPGPTDPPVSVSGLIPAGWATRYYAVRYRNAATFCTAWTFNNTNGVQVTWRP